MTEPNVILLTLFASLTESVFGWAFNALGDSDTGEKLRKFLSRDPARLAFQKCLANSYLALNGNFPEWTSSLLDEQFLLHNKNVSKELSKILSRTGEPEIQTLASLWENQFGKSTHTDGEELFIVIEYFVSTLETECKAQNALQPFFDSKSLEKLNNIAESSVALVETTNQIHITINAISKRLDNFLQKQVQESASNLKIQSSSLPNRKEFIGRQEKISEILSYLSPNARQWLISIEGPGGVGKTALALEASYICAEQGLFDLIIWTTAQEKFLGDNGVEVVEPEIKTLEDIWDAIGRANRSNFADLPPIEKRNAALNLLASKRCLLIVDNFETIKDSGIATFLNRQIPTPSKAIITSRLRLGGSGEIVELRGLTLPEAKTFIDSLSSQRELHTLEEGLMEEIHKWSGGVPLALKWVMGRFSKLQSKEQIIEIIKALPDHTDETLLNYCFQTLYDNLGPAEKVLLFSLVIFPASVKRDILSKVSDLKGLILDDSIKILWEKSLLEYTRISEEYSCLPLTRMFSKDRLKDEIRLDMNLLYKRALDYMDENISSYSSENKPFEIKHENITAVLDWCVSNPDMSTLQIAQKLTWYLGILGLTTERNKYGLALSRAANENNMEEEAMWIEGIDVGYVLIGRGMLKEATDTYQRLLAVAEAKNYYRVVGLCYRNMGYIKIRLDQETRVPKKSPRTASKLLEEAKELAYLSLKYWEKSTEPRWIAITYGTLGGIATEQEKYEEAQQYYRKALEIDEEIKNWEGIALAKSNLGRIELKLGRFDTALQLTEDALAIDGKMKRQQGIAAGLRRKAYILDRLGNTKDARDLIFESSRIYEKIDSFPHYQRALREVDFLDKKLNGEETGYLF